MISPYRYNGGYKPGGAYRPVNLDTNRVNLKFSDVRFWGLTMLFTIALYSSLLLTTATPLILITFPLVAYDRAFMFPIFMAIPLAQGAFITDQVDTDTMAESISLATVLPLLAYDVFTLKSKVVPYRFVVWYVLFVFFVLFGQIVYWQHPENLSLGLDDNAPTYKPVVRCVTRLIKIGFYFFYLKVLINYSVNDIMRTLEYSRKLTPFIVMALGVYLLLHGTAVSGANQGGGESLQLGDAHHGAFTSQLCSIGIYLYVTLFKEKEKIWNRVSALIALTMMFIIIMQMGSRNGLVCFALVSALGVYVNITNKRLDYQFLVAFVIAVIGIAGIIFSLNSPTVKRAIYMTEVEQGGNRWYYWEAGLTALSHYPFTGMGGDESASIAAVSKYGPGFIDDKVMHNSYLEFAVEYGYIGFLFYVSFLFYIFVWSYRLFRFALSKNYRLLTAPSVSFLILMFSALFVSRIWETAIWYNLSLVLALSYLLIYRMHVGRKKVNTYSAFRHQVEASGGGYRN